MTAASRVICAELTGSTVCRAAGIRVDTGSPVLAMCRALIAAGYDPATPLHAYRGATLCLTVRSIGEAAKLRVNNSGTGFTSLYEPPIASPVRVTECDEGEQPKRTARTLHQQPRAPARCAMTAPDTLTAVLDYAALGWQVFPLKPQSKEPATRRGFYDATDKPGDVAPMVWQGFPHNIAIRTGAPSGVFILDIDGELGASNLCALVAEHGALPATLDLDNRQRAPLVAHGRGADPVQHRQGRAWRRYPRRRRLCRRAAEHASERLDLQVGE